MKKKVKHLWTDINQLAPARLQGWQRLCQRQPGTSGRGRSPLWPLPAVLFPVLWSAPSRGSNYPLKFISAATGVPPGIRLCVFSKLIKRLAVWKRLISTPICDLSTSANTSKQSLTGRGEGLLNTKWFPVRGPSFYEEREHCMTLWRLHIFSWATVLRLHNSTLCMSLETRHSFRRMIVLCSWILLVRY